MAAGSSESEVLAQELESLGQKIHAFETRLAEVERIIRDLEAAAPDHGSRHGADLLALGRGV
jgi:hypothetical protein